MRNGHYDESLPFFCTRLLAIYFPWSYNIKKGCLPHNMPQLCVMITNVTVWIMATFLVPRKKKSVCGNLLLRFLITSNSNYYDWELRRQMIKQDVTIICIIVPLSHQLYLKVILIQALLSLVSTMKLWWYCTVDIRRIQKLQQHSLFSLEEIDYMK